MAHEHAPTCPVCPACGACLIEHGGFDMVDGEHLHDGTVLHFLVTCSACEAGYKVPAPVRAEHTTILPERYVLALQALKDQAAAASVSVHTDRDAARSALLNAHERMTVYQPECDLIVRALMRCPDDGITIPSVTHAMLAQILFEDVQGGSGCAIPAHTAPPVAMRTTRSPS